MADSSGGSGALVGDDEIPSSSHHHHITFSSLGGAVSSRCNNMQKRHANDIRGEKKDRDCSKQKYYKCTILR